MMVTYLLVLLAFFLGIRSGCVAPSWYFSGVHAAMLRQKWRDVRSRNGRSAVRNHEVLAEDPKRLFTQLTLAGERLQPVAQAVVQRRHEVRQLMDRRDTRCHGRSRTGAGGAGKLIGSTSDGRRTRRRTYLKGWQVFDLALSRSSSLFPSL